MSERHGGKGAGFAAALSMVSLLGASCGAQGSAQPSDNASHRPIVVADREAKTLIYQDQAGIHERNLILRGRPQLLISLPGQALAGMAADANWLYVGVLSETDGPHGEILRVPLSGGGPSSVLVSSLALRPAGLVLAGGYLYWDDGPTIGRISIEDSRVQRQFVALPPDVGGDAVAGLAGNSTYLYFSRCGDSVIGRIDLATAKVEDGFVRLADRSCPQALAVAGDHLYWAQLGEGPGRIGRVTLSTRQVEPKWVATKSGPYELAADPSYVYWGWGGNHEEIGYIARTPVSAPSKVTELFATAETFALGY